VGGRSLTPEDVDAIAQRVVELLPGSARPEGMLDTAAVAQFVGVSEDYVRDHAGELGAVRVGDSPRGALRFDRRRVLDALEARRVAPDPAAPRRPGPRHGPRDVELIELPPWAA